MAESCPYCNNARSMLLGNVFCSRNHKSMEVLETGTFSYKSKKLEETAEHISRLSIRCSANGDQFYKVGGKDYRVDNEKYLLINQGQRYQTSFQGNDEQEMLLVAFKPGFAENVAHQLVASQELLLDEPFFIPGEPIDFFEQTYSIDPVTQQIFQKLKTFFDMDHSMEKEIYLNDHYEKLMINLLNVHFNIKKDLDKFHYAKPSTKIELYKRLSIAKEYMDAHLDRKLKMQQVAQQAMLSEFHFNRSFKYLYGISPNQYHVEQRLKKAKELIVEFDFSVEQICIMVGFESSSSFIRLFKNYYGSTPGALKNLIF